MSSVYEDAAKTVVRRRGGVDTVGRNFGVPSGDRRSRQIAKRHWVRKERRYIDSGGGYDDFVTIRPPGRGAHHLRKPVR